MAIIIIYFLTIEHDDRIMCTIRDHWVVDNNDYYVWVSNLTNWRYQPESRKKKNNPKNSGHYVPATTPKGSAHTLLGPESM